MSVVAHVVHTVVGRTRVKIPSKRGHIAYFYRTGQQLSECPGVSQVASNFRTGSLLIKHTVPFAQIVAFAGEHDLFALQAEKRAPDNLPQQIATSLVWLDAHVTNLSGGELDLRAILIRVLLTIGLLQIARGEILAPASTLLGYVLGFLNLREALKSNRD
jgi:hypothetical protein